MSSVNQGAVMNQKSRFKVGYMIRISIFAAIAWVVMFVEFPIFASAPYLEVDFSDVIAFIGGVVMGPLAVVLIELVKNLLHLILNSSTGGVGELSNFMVGVALMLPPVAIYRARKKMPILIAGFVVGIVTMVVVASLGNYFIFLPLYGVSTEDMMAGIISLYAPFNIFKGLIEGTVAVVLHQSLKGIYKYIAAEQK